MNNINDNDFINSLLKVMKEEKQKNIKKKKDLIEQAIEKYKSLQEQKYIKSEELYKGDIIRYVDLNLDKLSASCIIIDIEYYRSLDESTTVKSIKNIIVKNNYNEKYWKFKPQKYLIFKYLSQDKLKKFLKKYLTEI
jgi:hypothetical protein